MEPKRQLVQRLERTLRDSEQELTQLKPTPPASYDIPQILSAFLDIPPPTTATIPTHTPGAEALFHDPAPFDSDPPPPGFIRPTVTIANLSLVRTVR